MARAGHINVTTLAKELMATILEKCNSRFGHCIVVTIDTTYIYVIEYAISLSHHILFAIQQKINNALIKRGIYS